MIKTVKSEKISVVGLGKLGAPMSACFASKGHSVIGVDLDPKTIQMMNAGTAPVLEPGLQDLLTSNNQKLVATDDYDRAILDSNITFIVVPTPSDKRGAYSLKYVLSACEGIGKALRKKSIYHVVVLVSTVLPGATESEVKSQLESHSGRRCGVDFGLCYSPEFIALGDAIRGFLHPDLVLIGESDSQAGDVIESFYATICDSDVPIARMAIVNAELAKLSINAFVTVKITFANMLARICEQMPGGNVDSVTSAVGLDRRIGPRYFKGAIGYGGPCFPRDNRALAYFARKLDLTAKLSEATDLDNQWQGEWLAETVKARLPEGGTVGILGFAYKPKTNVLEESPGLALAQSLVAAKIPTIVYDPVKIDREQSGLTGKITFAESMNECVTGADVVVITTQDEVFKKLSPQIVERASQPRVLIDCWRILEPCVYEKVAEYVPLGIYGGV